MQPQVLLSDIELQTQDFLANYSVTSLPMANIDRGINRAIEFVQRRLGLPSDMQVQSFYFYEDTKFYPTATGFNELIGLKYNTSANASIVDCDPNTPRRRWNVYKDTEIAQTTGVWPDENQVAFTTMNGSSQLLLHGRNNRPSATINAFNSTGGLVFSSDISSVAQDTNVYKYGAASLSFNINTGLSSSSISFNGLWNIQQYLNYNLAYRLYVDFPVGTTGYFTNIELRLQSSAGNYYSMTATTQSDGTAWNSGSWSLLSWQLSNATTVGTPNPAQITSIYVVPNHSGSFATTTGMRINYLYQVIPDYLDCMYYSSYKGTDTTGATKKIILNASSDIVSFGAYAPDLVLPVSLKAATILSPQILADPNFRAMWKEDFMEAMLVWGRVYPRRRATGNFGQTYLRRSGSGSNGRQI